MSGLIERIKQSVQTFRQTNIALTGAWQPQDDKLGKIHSGDYEAMAKANIGTVYAATGAISRSVAKAELRLYSKKGKSKSSGRNFKLSDFDGGLSLSKFYRAKGYEIEEIEEHPFLDLMSNVNPMMNKFELKELTQSYLDLIGNCYWYIRKNQLKLPGEVWVLQGQYVKILPDKEKLVKGYLYQPPGVATGVFFDTDEIIHFKYQNINDMYYGYSPLLAAAYSADSETYMKKYQMATFQNMAVPGLTLETEKSMSERAFKRLKSMLNSLHMGASKANKTLLLEEGVKPHKLSLTPVELSFIEGMKLTKQEILEIYGVPPTKLGFGETTNRATAEALDFTFQSETILPRLIRLQEKINEKLIKLWDENLFVQFDNPVPQDKEYELRRRDLDIKNGVFSINEERQNMGWD